MTDEYQRARQHWLCEIQQLNNIGLHHAPENEKRFDERFELCVLLYQHLKKAKQNG